MLVKLFSTIIKYSNNFFLQFVVYYFTCKYLMHLKFMLHNKVGKDVLNFLKL